MNFCFECTNHWSSTDRNFSDGSYLAKVHKNSWSLANDCYGIVVRIIEYTLDDPQRTGHQEVYRLMTNLMDSEEFPAMELIIESHERREEEIVFDELKTHQDPCCAEKVTHLGSEKSDGLTQELYALSLSRFVTWVSMLEASTIADFDTDRQSFEGCFQILKTRPTECKPQTETSFAAGLKPLSGR